MEELMKKKRGKLDEKSGMWRLVFFQGSEMALGTLKSH